jgi:hypothetical protein
MKIFIALPSGSHEALLSFTSVAHEAFNSDSAFCFKSFGPSVRAFAKDPVAEEVTYALHSTLLGPKAHCGCFFHGNVC